jgi:hypothetical protein
MYQTAFFHPCARISETPGITRFLMNGEQVPKKTGCLFGQPARIDVFQDD